MIEKHGTNLQEYVLTLMSTVSTSDSLFFTDNKNWQKKATTTKMIFFNNLQVSSIYSDSSIGNSINVAVVHILFIKEDLVHDAKDGKGK